MNARTSQTIRSHSFLVTVPEEYNVIKHDVYEQQRKFFDVPAARAVRPFAYIDWLKGFFTYEVVMGAHRLVFYTQIGDSNPEDMKHEFGSQSRSAVELHDFHVGSIKGKTVGEYSGVFSVILWSLKKRDCRITFCLQGAGYPSDEVKADVHRIVQSIK